MFSAQNFWPTDAGASGEGRQGKIVADPAKAAGAHYFVKTSVRGAQFKTGLTRFDS